MGQFSMQKMAVFGSIFGANQHDGDNGLIFQWCGYTI